MMLRSMISVSIVGRNKECRDQEDKMRECILRWLVHVVRKDKPNYRRVWDLEIGRRRPNMRWKDVVMKNMSEIHLDVDLRVASSSGGGNTVPDPTDGTR